MRRFITSLPGKIFSQLVILALLLPTFSLALVGRAFAQVNALPTWAVVEFRNIKSAGTTFGKTASDAVASELAKTGQYDVSPAETVSRTISDLGVTSPPSQTNLLRIGAALKASTIVNGEILNYKITSDSSGKMATVNLRIVVTDVASGLAVNGSDVTASSTQRPVSVDDAVLVSDAITAAASQGVAKILSQTLPTGTILNTQTDIALLNQGTRAGFKNGMEVIILRGREQVATGTVSDVQFDSCYLNITRNIKGVKPGDKVRAVFTPPPYRITPSGEPIIAKRKSGANMGGVVTVVLVLGLLLALLGSGSNSDVVSDVTAEATLYPTNAGSPAVKVSWSPNGFAKGNANRIGWQIWRNDVFDTPVQFADGAQTTVYDTDATRTTLLYWPTAGVPVGGTICNYTGNPIVSNTGTYPGVQVGRPYIYSVELVYALTTNDLPQGDSGGSGGNSTSSGSTSTGTTSTGSTSGNTGTTGGNTGTTGGNTGSTGGNTGSTSGNTGSTSGGGGTLCYFLSQRTVSKGVATPLSRATLQSPSPGQSVSGPTPFTFSSAVGSNPITVEYIVQFSDSPTFAAGRVVTAATVVKNTTGTISTGSIDTSASSLPAYIRSAQTVYWRVGARNLDDKPGPVKDPSTGLRYVFGTASTFTRPGGPPPPPTN